MSEPKDDGCVHYCFRFRNRKARNGTLAWESTAAITEEMIARGILSELDYVMRLIERHVTECWRNDGADLVIDRIERTHAGRYYHDYQFPMPQPRTVVMAEGYTPKDVPTAKHFPRDVIFPPISPAHRGRPVTEIP